jgi:cation-transporting ATPase 13A3/4/5
LIREILYPKVIEFKFTRDSYLFVLVTIVIAIVGYAISIPKMKLYGFGSLDIGIRFADTITIAVPPALPAVLGSCIAFTISRMQN